MKVTHYNLDGTSYVVEVEDYTPTAEELQMQRLAEIDSLKAELATYDYIGVKIATGCATIEQYAEQIAHCEVLRQRINELEKEAL